MNSNETASLSGDRQNEDGIYELSATLAHYEVKELSGLQMAKMLCKIGQNCATTVASAGATLAATFPAAPLAADQSELA